MGEGERTIITGTPSLRSRNEGSSKRRSRNRVREDRGKSKKGRPIRKGGSRVTQIVVGSNPFLHPSRPSDPQCSTEHRRGTPDHLGVGDRHCMSGEVLRSVLIRKTKDKRSGRISFVSPRHADPEGCSAGNISKLISQSTPLPLPLSSTIFMYKKKPKGRTFSVSDLP